MNMAQNWEAPFTGMSMGSVAGAFSGFAQVYAPEMEKRLRWYWRNPSDLCRGMDETYVKVNGRWSVSVPSRRQPGARTVDFYLSSRRNPAKLHTGFWVKSSTT